jgi:uncharacterized protein YjiS (DUF1127 family)
VQTAAALNEANKRQERLMIAQSTNSTHRAGPALTTLVGRLARRAWGNYWDWRARKATVQILRSLDARTLQDIGLSRAEIESVVYGNPEERRRHYEECWHSRGGA